MAQSDPLSPSHPTPSSARLVERLDRAIAWVLRVQPQSPEAQPATGTASRRPFGLPLFIAAVRCTLGYIVLPFVFPLLGVAMGVGFGIGLILDVVATVIIVTTLRGLWRRQHSRRWHYLPVALTMAVLIAVSLAHDARVLFV